MIEFFLNVEERLLRTILIYSMFILPFQLLVRMSTFRFLNLEMYSSMIIALGNLNLIHEDNYKNVIALQ
jgi:hypothetical protein